MQFRDLRKQYAALKPQMDEAISHVLDDCCFISGTQVGELESRLATYVGAKHCITCASGTDAIRLALMAYGIGSGDAVFVPDFTFFATAEMPAALGATPVFVDVSGETFNIDTNKLEQAIRHTERLGILRPRAIIAVDLFGQCADYKTIEEIAEKHNLLIIEDAAQSFGAEIGSKRACSFGNIAATSFFPSKPLGCYGDGGAVFTNDDGAAALIRSYAVHGKGNDKYDNERIGLNSRLDTVQAAILLIKLDAFEKRELDNVNMVADLYTEKLKNIVRTPVVSEKYYSSWAQYTIKLSDKNQRQLLHKSLKNIGIPTMIYYPKGLHRQGAFIGLPNYNSFPVTNLLCDTVLSLPMHPYMTERDIDEVTEGIKCCLSYNNRLFPDEHESPLL